VSWLEQAIKRRQRGDPEGYRHFRLVWHMTPYRGHAFGRALHRARRKQFDRMFPAPRGGKGETHT